MIIVVSRYNEDIKWTQQFPNVVICNKGNKLNGEYNEILLNNVGREGHTYYKFIYDNYENLEDYYIFLQGNPFDHSPNIIKKINEYHNKSILNIDFLSETIIDFEFLSETIIDCNLHSCKYHHGLPLLDVYNKLFDQIPNCDAQKFLFQFGAGAQFIVSRKQILKRPKEFYLKIVKLLETNISPIEGYVIERFHKLIFS